MFPVCACRHRYCRCAGDMHGYRDGYVGLLSALRPKQVFEWGPGANTEMALADPECEVFAVEHQPKWVPVPLDDRFQCLVCGVDSPSYVNLHNRDQADVFFVDGRRRDACLNLVFLLGSLKSVVCLHDAQRIRYHEALGKFPHIKFCGNGFAAASKSPLIMLGDDWGPDLGPGKA